MALPQDSLWPIRRDHIKTLIKMLQDAKATITPMTITDAITQIGENLGNRLKEYSDKITLYGQYLNSVFGDLFNNEEYHEADIEVNGLPSDVIVQLTDGLNVSTEDLTVSESGNWVSNIYNILVDMKASTDNLNDILSYIQYGFDTWEDAKKITFPDPFPESNSIIASGRSLGSNLMFSWPSQTFQHLATVRMIGLRDGEKSATPDVLTTGTIRVYLALTIGEGSIDEYTTIRFLNGVDDYLLCPWNPSVWQADMNKFVAPSERETANYAPSVNILLKDPTDGHYFFGACAVWSDVNGILIKNPGTDPNGFSVQIVNHTTYMFHLRQRSGDYRVTTTEPAGQNFLKRNLLRVKLNPSITSIETWREDNAQTYTRINYKQELAMTSATEASSADKIKPGSCFFIRENVIAGKVDGFPFIEFSTFDTTKRIQIDLQMSYQKIPNSTSTTIERARILIIIKILQAFTITYGYPLRFYEVPVATYPTVRADFGSNLDPATTPTTIGNRGTLQLSYNKVDCSFTLTNLDTADAVLNYGEEIAGNLLFPVATGKNPTFTFEAGATTQNTLMIVRNYIGDYTTTPATSALPEYLGVFANYGIGITDAQRPFYVPGSVIKAIGVKRGAGAIFPNPELPPTKTYTGARHKLKVYVLPSSLIIYEFEITNTDGWTMSKDSILLSAGTLDKDYVPTHSLVIQIGAASYIIMRSDGSIKYFLIPSDVGHLRPGYIFTTFFPSSRLLAKAAKNTATTSPVTTLNPLAYIKTIPLGESFVKEKEMLGTARDLQYYEWPNVNFSDLKVVVEGGTRTYKHSYITKDPTFPIQYVVYANINDDAPQSTTWVNDATTAADMKLALVTNFTRAASIFLYTADGIPMRAMNMDVSPTSTKADGATEHVTINFTFVVGKFPWAKVGIDQIAGNLNAIISSLQSLTEEWENINKLDYFKAIDAHTQSLRTHVTLASNLIEKVIGQSAGLTSTLIGSVQKGAEYLLKKMDVYAERFKTS